MKAFEEEIKKSFIPPCNGASYALPLPQHDKLPLKFSLILPRGFGKHLLFFLLLLSFSAFSGEKTEDEKALEQIFSFEREFYIEALRNPAYSNAGKMEEAAAKFAKKKKDSDAKFRAKALLSAILRSEEKFDKALEIVADCDDFDKISSNSNFPFKSSYLACFLELAHAKVGNCGAISSRCRADALPESRGGASGMSLCRRDGQPAQALDNEKIAPQFSTASLREAMKMLDYAERNTEGYDKALALFKHGDVLFSLCEFRKSESYLNRAKAVLADLMKTEKSKASSEDSSESLSESSKKPNPDISLLKKRIDALLFSVFIELLEEDYGEAYALYVKARSFHDEASFEAASFICREVFTKYEKTVYEQALRLTYADCLVATGEVKEAKKWLLDMIEKYPKSPYLGEAMMKLGEISLEHDWDCKQSASYYNQALAWFRAERERKDTLDLYTVPEKVATVSVSPDPFSSLDGWGRTVYRDEKPMEIITAQNAPWYVSEMEKECLFMVGFFLFIEGKFDEAKECFLQVKTISKDLAMLDAKGMPNALWRLESACNVRRMLFSPEEKKSLKGGKKLLCAYAELNFILEKFDEACSLFRRIGEGEKVSGDEKAISTLGMMNSSNYGPETEKILKELLKTSKNEDIRGNALVSLAAYYQSSSKTAEKAVVFYEEYLRKCKGGRFSNQALFRVAEAKLKNGETSVAGTMIEDLKKNSPPNSGYVRSLEAQMKNLNK